MPRVLIVGAGILGTCHAWFAQDAGWDVVLIDRHGSPRGATVRNFGLVWVSGRRGGKELETAQRARDLWEELGRHAAEIGFRPDGSMTIAFNDAEREVLVEAADRPDAPDRGFSLLDAGGVRAHNPALRGRFVAGLLCRRDAVVEPRAALGALRAAMERRSVGDDRSATTGRPPGTFSFESGLPVTSVGERHVVLEDGRRLEADAVIVCAGAEQGGPVAELLSDAPLRRCRLQMMQTAPLGERMASSVADADSLRYYPAFDLPSLTGLPPQQGVAAELRMQLLISQRADGSLTIGDTHDYDEPFAFDLDEEAYSHMSLRAETILGRPLPPVQRRWAGVYSQLEGDGICWRDEAAPGVWVVTGAGGRGMTLAPAIAEETLRHLTAGSRAR